jgi:hypothetical protein
MASLASIGNVEPARPNSGRTALADAVLSGAAGDARFAILRTGGDAVVRAL